MIIAPLRVVKTTWADEIRKWDHLRGLTCSVAVGSEKERLAALNTPADVYVINRENIPWLVDESGLPFDFDMLVIDELSSFKNRQTKRFKALMKVRPRVKRIVGLTGTPSSNGLMDLWAEFKILDKVPRMGYGQASRAVHRAVPKRVLRPGQDERADSVKCPAWGTATSRSPGQKKGFTRKYLISPYL